MLTGFHHRQESPLLLMPPPQHGLDEMGTSRTVRHAVEKAQVRADEVASLDRTSALLSDLAIELQSLEEHRTRCLGSPSAVDSGVTGRGWGPRTSKYTVGRGTRMFCMAQGPRELEGEPQGHVHPAPTPVTLSGCLWSFPSFLSSFHSSATTF